MTKEEFKSKFLENGKLTWDKIKALDLDFMYNHYHFIDSNVAEIFEVPIEIVVCKRKELNISIKKDDFAALKIYKQRGNLRWEEINYNRFDYLYKWCNFSDSTIAELFDIPKRIVTGKRKEFGIFLFGRQYVVTPQFVKTGIYRGTSA